jgi:hypothetical protein
MLWRQAQSILLKASRTNESAGDPPQDQPAAGYDSLRTREKKAAFLGSFGKCLSVKESAQLAGIDRTTHYDWLRADAKYKKAFELELRQATDFLTDKLVELACVGVFKPYFYKGKVCYASRKRTICDLADGTSAFADELPKGAEVTKRRTVTVRDGKMLGVYKSDTRALKKLLAAWFPEQFGPARRRRRRQPTPITPAPKVIWPEGSDC